MAERTEQVTTADGTMEVFIAHPDGPGPFPVLVQFMDATGMREELRGLARRVAAWGYYVMQMDLLYRDGIKGPLDPTDESLRPIIMAAVKNLTDERAISDVKTALKIADSDPAARNGDMGLYGFCMGGRTSVVLAQALGSRVVAVASLHPGFLVQDGPGSPHRNLDKIKAEIYFGIADKDHMATPEQMAELEKGLKANHISYQLNWVPAPHGFMFPSRKHIYNEAVAEAEWGRIRALMDRKLQ